MTDYNDGKWHGRNGGECPVHPKSKVMVGLAGSKPAWRECAGQYDWTHDARDEIGNIVAFRVVKPYAEPVEYTGECSACHYIGQAPMMFSIAPRDNIIAGRYTATHINGKLARIVWEATE